MEGPNRPEGQADNWWWLTVQIGDKVHLYELGYPTKGKDGEDVALTEQRRREIMDELGNPEAFVMSMAPGRPGSAYLEPKRIINEATGELGEIVAKPGVTLHLKDK